jgi:two-component system LytT family response regulator
MTLPSHEPFHVLVVDDEAPARKRLLALLSKDPEIGRISEAANGVTAVTAIETMAPDLVFLDVQMPKVDGFGVIEKVGAARMPLTVFVTAYDQFALAAFEAEAIDYLLKPFGDKRYEKTMARVKARLHDARSGNSGDAHAFGSSLIELLEKRATPGKLWDQLVIKSRGITELVMVDDIDWIEAAGIYVTLHAGGREFLYRAGLATMTSRLDPFRFVRIHRSSMVNIKSILRLERRSHGEFDVVLKDGTKLILSRSYRAEVETMLGQSL